MKKELGDKEIDSFTSMWDVIRSSSIAVNSLINNFRDSYKMPDNPEMKRGARFRSNTRIWECMDNNFQIDMENGTVKTVEGYLRQAFDKMCELDWHYSNKEKWQ